MTKRHGHLAMPDGTAVPETPAALASAAAVVCALVRADDPDAAEGVVRDVCGDCGRAVWREPDLPAEVVDKPRWCTSCYKRRYYAAYAEKLAADEPEEWLRRFLRARYRVLWQAGKEFVEGLPRSDMVRHLLPWAKWTAGVWTPTIVHGAGCGMYATPRRPCDCDPEIVLAIDDPDDGKVRYAVFADGAVERMADAGGRVN